MAGLLSLRSSLSLASLTLASLLVPGCCGGGSRGSTAKDAEMALAACAARPQYSAPMSAAMRANLDKKCATSPDACGRIKGTIAGVCVYQNKVAKVAISDRVEVYATLGTSNDLALDELCSVMRSLPDVGFLQDVDVWVARSGTPYWGKSWRRRCAQGSGGGNEHR